MAGAVQSEWPEELRELGARVRMLRKRRKMSGAALAAHVGIHPSAITRLEQGKQLTDLLILFAIADTLHAPPEFIITGRGDLPPAPLADPTDRDKRRRPKNPGYPGPM